MENKINIAEILKDCSCSSGMELDCTIYEDVYFDYVDELNIIHCYIQHETYKTSLTFNQYGIYNSGIKAKCVIFPKGKTTWEGFVPPCKFKDGDIVVTKTSSNFIFYSIFQGIENREVLTYMDYSLDGNRLINVSPTLCYTYEIIEQRFATEEEKEKLFQAIKDNGYKWNAETKTLEKLPKFKIGDKIKKKGNNDYRLTTIESINNNYYVIKTPDWFDNCYITDKLPFNCQDKYELVPNKFDISNLKPFDKVLVRCNSLEKWHIQFFEKYNTELGAKYPFICLCNNKYCQCIPYENNQHLLDTANDCNDFYKTWK